MTSDYAETFACYALTLSCTQKKTINLENVKDFVAVVIVFAIVLGHLFNKRTDFYLIQIPFFFVLIILAIVPQLSKCLKFEAVWGVLN